MFRSRAQRSNQQKPRACGRFPSTPRFVREHSEMLDVALDLGFGVSGLGLGLYACRVVGLGVGLQGLEVARNAYKEAL